MRHVFNMLMITLGLGLYVRVANAAPFFVNAGFETDSWAAGTASHVSPSGWTSVQSADFRYIQGVHNTSSTTDYFTPFGNQFIILCAANCANPPGSPLGSVSQVVGGFTAGLMYQLDFQQSPESDSEGRFDSVVGVTIEGLSSSTTLFSAVSVGVAGHSFATWKAQSLTFTADSSTLTFTFAGAINTGAIDIESGIDNIGLTALTSSSPEPASVMLFGFGLSLFGLGGCRKKS